MTKRATLNDVVWGISWVLLAILSYQVLNRIGRDYLIDISTEFDQAIPLVPAFVIPYLSFIPIVFVFVPAMALRSSLVFRSYTLSIFVAQMILNVLYLLVPATVVRPTIESNDIFSILLRDLV